MGLEEMEIPSILCSITENLGGLSLEGKPSCHFRKEGFEVSKNVFDFFTIRKLGGQP